MKERKLTETDLRILRWYQEYPECFDTDNNNSWLLFYMEKWLGVQKYTPWLVEQRMKQIPYETFRRSLQKLIHEGLIKLTEKNYKARKRAETKVHEEFKEDKILKPKLIGHAWSKTKGFPVYEGQFIPQGYDFEPLNIYERR